MVCYKLRSASKNKGKRKKFGEKDKINIETIENKTTLEDSLKKMINAYESYRKN
mgnify:CR=1 FL=1